MAGKGGARKGAGRKKNSTNAEKWIGAALEKAGHEKTGLFDKAVELAMGGDAGMIRTLLSKVLPDLKAVEATIEHSGEDLIQQILKALDCGGLPKK